jgi:hypothetical protein
MVVNMAVVEMHPAVVVMMRLAEFLILTERPFACIPASLSSSRSSRRQEGSDGRWSSSLV